MLTRRALLAALGSVIAGCGDQAPSPARETPPGSAPTPPAPSARSSAATLDPSAPITSAPGRPPDRPGSSAQAPRAGGEVQTRAIELGPLDGGPHRAVIVVPAFGTEDERFPLLVALHGLGETRKGQEAGSWGWVKDYWLDRAVRRLRSPPLTRADFQGLVAADRLAKINASLGERPFRGLVVACPFTPDLLETRSLDNAGPFADLVASHLIPLVRRGAPVLDARAATGIDGVSLGGRLSLLSALERPDAFGAVGVMQGAFELNEIDQVAARVQAQRERRPPRLRLVTSAGDYYREATAQLHEALSKKGVAHEHVVLPGPHDYVWNRGPGAIEMLLWHDRVLRGEAPEP